MAKRMWSFKTKNFTVIWEIESDVLDTQHMDAELAAECRRNVRSGKWKCFTSTIRVMDNATKVDIGEAYLGGSIYEKPAEFRDHFGMNRKGHGSYFSQMVREAVAEARKRFPELQERTRREVQAKQPMLGVKLKAKRSTGVSHA